MTLSLEQAIAELPDTADGIAAHLIAQECRGKRQDGECCPVSNYLRGTGDFPAPFVDFTYVYSDGALESGEHIDTPEHVGEFITRFDDGEWPELDADA